MKFAEQISYVPGWTRRTKAGRCLTRHGRFTHYYRVQNDNYGRLRGYAFVPCRQKFKDYCQSDEINVNIAMVRAGLARVKTTVLWQKPKYEAELKQAEEEAKSRHLGLWATAP